MSFEYSVEVCKQLQQKVLDTNLHRPVNFGSYQVGDELTYEIKSILSGDIACVRVAVEKFVGGGFAGQVYRVKVLEIQIEDENAEHIDDIVVGNVYAMKILIPPSGFSLFFRNFIYAIGFQGPFQLQVNPEAARAGAIWQKFIRRAAKIRFGNEDAVNDIHATFIDHTLGSCGEFSGWVDGRTWRLEVDENLDTLKLWKKNKPVDKSKLGSDEYRAKRKFMKDFVELLHEVGAHEFARQYEWSTCKSQPNCLKRTGTDDDPAAGLMAVDFRAGLALLPFLPMSPGDFKLIGKGLVRNSLVQFDRGDIDKLQAFINEHRGQFNDIVHLIKQLKQAESVYRDSLPDITHNHVRLLYSGKLWSTILDSAVTGWRVRNQIDAIGEQKLRGSKFRTLLLCLVSMIPFVGRFVKKSLYHGDWRKHYGAMLTNFGYFKCAVRAKACEKVLSWYRAGRVTEAKAEKLTQCPICFFCHAIFSILPAGVHRFITDGKFFKEKLHFIFARPVKLYFSRPLREQWLLDMVSEGKKNHILTDEDADTIVEQLKEPYIQKYLISLVVHLLTLPVTQIVGLIISLINWIARDLTWEQAFAEGTAIMIALQIVPLSPGSFCRGLYTTILAIKERNFKDYNIALFLSYFKYVGYLAFPIQMANRYPAIARFMAGHWATGAVHIVPVFGERGALLEHWVFCLFYNWPLTIRRRVSNRLEQRVNVMSRYWHIPFIALLGTTAFVIVDKICFWHSQHIPTLMSIWYFTIAIPVLCGVAVTLAAGGLVLWKRFAGATICGFSVGLLSILITYNTFGGDFLTAKDVFIAGAWRVFAMSFFATIGAIFTEINLPDKELSA